MSYLIPTEDLTLTDTKRFRQAAVNRGIQLAVGLRIVPIGELLVNGVSYVEGMRIPPEAELHHPSLVVRHADNVVDFGAGVGGWLTMTLAVVGTAVSVFATAVPAALTPTLAVTRVAIFYSVSVETTPMPVNLLTFTEGVAAGTTYAVFDLEELAVKQSLSGYFTEPVVYKPQKVMNIQVTPRIATGAQARVRLGCFIVEPTGAVIS